MPIRVLHIFGKMNRGGAEMRTVELMPLLSTQGVHFDFCTLKDGEGPLDEEIRHRGGDVFPCPLRPGVLSFGKRFVKFLKQSDYDIVHSHVHYFSGYIVRLAHKAGVKGRIVHFRNTYDGQSNTLARRLYRKIMHRSADKHATAILAVCRGAMEFSWGPDWQRDPRTQVIYNGLDLSAYQRSGEERKGVVSELGLPSNCKLIINVARFHPQKAHDVLLDAAVPVIAADAGIQFLLVGDGALRVEMEAKARAREIAGHVHFLGVRNDVPRLLKASDCFVLPSRWEGLPGVVLEAVAANLPVIATDLAGIREIAQHTQLITIVPLENAEILAKKILKILDTKNTYPQSSCFPVEFDLHNCAEKLSAVYISQV